MPTRWYICPYDAPEFPPPRTGRFRRCAMYRFIPRMPNVVFAVWHELEILGNHCLVKVRAPQLVLDQIEADPDFRQIPRLATIPGGSRPAIRTRLNALGYTDAEITATGWSLAALLALLASVRSRVRRRLDGLGFEVFTTDRLPPARPLADVEGSVPNED